MSFLENAVFQLGVYTKSTETSEIINIRAISITRMVQPLKLCVRLIIAVSTVLCELRMLPCLFWIAITVVVHLSFLKTCDHRQKLKSHYFYTFSSVKRAADNSCSFIETNLNCPFKNGQTVLAQRQNTTRA